jgi:hypothetical protein
MSIVRPTRLWNDYVFLLNKLLPVDAHIHPKTGNTGSVPLMVCVVEVQLQVGRRSLNQTESGLERQMPKNLARPELISRRRQAVCRPSRPPCAPPRQEESYYRAATYRERAEIP